MKPKKMFRSLLIPVFGISAMVLSSCTSVYFAFTPFRDYQVDSDDHETIIEDGYYKPGDYSSYRYLNGDGEEESFADFLDIY